MPSGGDDQSESNAPGNSGGRSAASSSASSQGNSNSPNAGGGYNGGNPSGNAQSAPSSPSGYSGPSTQGNNNSPNAGGGYNGGNPSGNAQSTPSSGGNSGRSVGTSATEGYSQYSRTLSAAGFLGVDGRSVADAMSPGSRSVNFSMNAPALGFMVAGTPSYAAGTMAYTATPPTDLRSSVSPTSVASYYASGRNVTPLGSTAAGRYASSVYSAIQGAEAQRAVNPATGKYDPYNGLVSGVGTPTHTSLTDMSVGEVQDYQKSMISNGHASTAVGAYQAMSATLGDFMKSEQAKAAGITKESKFNENTQDEFADWAIGRRTDQASKMPGGVNAENLSKALAQEWAGLATASGKSAYAGVGNNKATVGYNTTQSIAEGVMAGKSKSSSNVNSVQPSSVGLTAYANTPAVGPANQTSREVAYASPASPPSSRTAVTFAEKYLSPPAASATEARPTTAAQMAAAYADYRPGTVPAEYANTQRAMELAAATAPPTALSPNNYAVSVAMDQYQQAPVPGLQRTGLNVAEAPPSEVPTRSVPTVSITPENPNVLSPNETPPSDEVASTEAAVPNTTPVTTPEVAKEELGKVGKIAAGVADVALGSIPGLGIAITGVNGILGALGKETIGTALVGSFLNGGNRGDYTPDPNDRGGPVDVMEPLNNDVATTEAKPANDTFTARRFNYKYVKRPTPAEKWRVDI